MAIDPSIPLSFQAPHIMTPAEGLKLRDMALQYQAATAQFAEEQQQRQNRKLMLSDLQQPGAFDPQSGEMTPQTLAKITQRDPKLGFEFFQQNRMLAAERERTERARILRTAQQARAESQLSINDAKIKFEQARTEKVREENMHRASRDFTTAAISRYDSLVNSGAPADVSAQGWRDAWLDEIDKKEKDGSLRAAGYTDEQIQTLKTRIPTPEQAKQQMMTTKEREIKAKAEAESPFKSRQLDIQEKKLSLADIAQQTKAAQGGRALDIKQQQVENQAAIAERKAGISEEQIQARNEHDRAFIKLREAEDAVKADTAKTSAEERERHNKALEDARKAEQEARGKAYGMRAEKTSLLKADKEKESQIATLNRELEQGKITQEQHDAAVEKLTAQGRGGTAGRTEITVGAPKQLAARGYQDDGKGGLTYIRGGPADPDVIKRQAEARRAEPTRVGGSPTLATVAGGFETFTGQQLLDSLRPDIARKVAAINSGQFTAKDLAANRKEEAMLEGLVLQYNPKYEKPGPKSAKGPAMSPEVARFLAQRAWAGEQVEVGWARSPESKMALEKAIMEEGMRQGRSPAELSAKKAEFEGIRAGQRSLGVRGAQLGVSSFELDEFSQIAHDASLKVPRTNFVPLNRLMRISREQWSPDQAAFQASVESVLNAFGQVAARTGAATVHNREQFEKMLHTAQTQQQVDSVLKMMQTEAAGAMRATARTRGALSESVTGKTTRETPESKMPPVKPYSDAEKEKRYQEWKKKNGY